MSKDVLNNLAKRQVLKTSPYTKYLKKGGCKVEKTSTGDTKHTVLSLKDAALNYQNQTIDLAKALLSKDLQTTVGNIYSFLYSHFQYQADGLMQNLRSPQCSFADRFKGIDCKSYSLLASTILLNQNISHLIRRIKQPGYNSDYWTHVYIVVPKDQDKMDLSKGYYVIDGTLHSNKETPYTKKHDVIMSQDLPHKWLNGAAATARPKSSYDLLLERLLSIGVDYTIVDQIRSAINKSLIKGKRPFMEYAKNAIAINSEVFYLAQTAGLNGSADNSYQSQGSTDEDETSSQFTALLGQLTSIFGGLDCLGGSAYDKPTATADRATVSDFFKDLVLQINEAIKSQNMAAVSQAVLNFYGLSKVTFKTYNVKISEGWNSCTTKNLENTRDIISYFPEQGLSALETYLDTYFNKEYLDNKTFSNEPIGHLWGGWVRPLVFDTVPEFSFSIKDGVTAIPLFELNQTVSTSPDAQFNAGDFISSLGNIGLQSIGGLDLNGNPVTVDNTDTSGGYIGSNQGGSIPPTESKASIGVVEVLLGIGIGAGIYYGAKSANASAKKS